MAHITLALFQVDLLMVMADIFLMMAVIMKDKFDITQQKALVNMSIKDKITCTMDNGLIHYQAVKDRKYGTKKKVNTKDNFSMEPNMEEGSINFPINHSMRACLKMINFMEKVS